MRPGQQQNKQRMRGRGRKGPNPMSRSFESNGPDVKIRGTAQHIADKYTTLARDAAASGDRVMAENYLQHAEHYGRIVAAAQGQFQPSQPERDFDDLEDDGEEGGDFGGQQQPFAAGNNGNGQGGGYQNGQPQAYRDNRDNGQRDGGQRDGGQRDGGQRDGGQRDNNQQRDNRDGNGQRREFRDNRENQNRGDRPYQNRDNRDANAPRSDREGFQPREQRGDRPNGSGPQPFLRDEAEAGGGAPQARTEGSRREGRRERQRLNDRNGRFEDRFARPRDGEEADAARPSAEAGAPAPQPDAEASRPAPFEAQPAAEVRGPDTAAPSFPEAGAIAEPRRRGRPRRDRVEGEAAEAMPAAAEVSPVAMPTEPAPTAEPKRRQAKPAAPEAAAPAAPETGEAPAKRKPGRPRKKKPDDEGGDGEPHLPAFLLASNG